jgi:uncharacterized protein YqeY
MLLEKIKQDLIAAMKSKDETTLGTLRMLDSTIKNKIIERRTKGKTEPMTEDEIMEIISSEVKKRKDASDLYKKGNREELAKKELDEISVLKKYLPAELSVEEAKNIIKEAMSSSGLFSKADFGKLMGILKEKTKNRIDGSQLKNLLMEELK